MSAIVARFFSELPLLIEKQPLIADLPLFDESLPNEMRLRGADIARDELRATWHRVLDAFVPCNTAIDEVPIITSTLDVSDKLSRSEQIYVASVDANDICAAILLAVLQDELKAGRTASWLVEESKDPLERPHYFYSELNQFVKDGNRLTIFMDVVWDIPSEPVVRSQFEYWMRSTVPLP